MKKLRQLILATHALSSGCLMEMKVHNTTNARGSYEVVIAEIAKRLSPERESELVALGWKRISAFRWSIHLGKIGV